MNNFGIAKQWYEEIKDRVPHEFISFYRVKGFSEEMVEINILDESIFVRVSRELGWMY